MKELLAWGVEEFYVCAGARNIPLIEALSQLAQQGIAIHSHFEERAAGFYAIGRIKSTQKPVAVITTSGTAVGELLPAIIESYYADLPLVVVSADRPSSYRGTGAPQTVIQKNIFGPYVSRCFDLECEIFELKKITRNKPLHINVCFHSPLLSGEFLPISICDIKKYENISSQQDKNQSKKLKKIHNFLKGKNHILVILSKISSPYHEDLIKFLVFLNAPIYIESTSNLRHDPALSHLQIKCGDKIWKNDAKMNFKIEGVFKIGGTPTHRIWRDLDETCLDIPVFSVGESQFSGLSRAQHVQIFAKNFFNSLLGYEGIKKQSSTEFLQNDNLYFNLLLDLIAQYPCAEASFLHALSMHVPHHSHIYLGNSLPIRNWDLAAIFDKKFGSIEASRGANGIDGQISCFLGYSKEEKENWGIFGDLTTLYDLAAPWVLRYRPNIQVNICIINNNGGQIFKKVVPAGLSDLTVNSHQVEFKHWAFLWKISYLKVTHPSEFKQIKNSQNIIEICPNQQETDAFNERLNQI